MSAESRYYQKLRTEALASQNLIPDGGTYPQDYKGIPTKRAVAAAADQGYTPGDELHHRAIVKVYEPFFANLDDNEARILVDFLESQGVPVGNNPRNFTGMPKQDHIGTGGIHQYAADQGIQLKGDDLRLTKGVESVTGEFMPALEPFLNKIRNSDLQTRINILPDFIEYGQTMLDDKMRSMNYTFPSREKLKAEYKHTARKAINIEAARELVEEAAVLNTRGTPQRNPEKRVKTYIDRALAL